MSVVDALLGRWRGPSAQGSVRQQLEAARKQLATTETRLLKAREQEAKQQQRISDLEQKLERAQATADARRADATRNRRRVLSPSVLRDLLPARRVQVPHRAGARDAAQREQRLMDVSEEYRRAVSPGFAPPAEHARRIELDGLTWWVPVGFGDDEWAERMVAKERIPYRAFLHAREVCTGGIMLDLGAHDGGTAIPRVILGDVEACYCAEPDPVNYACLVANVVENGLRGFVLPDRIAIGATDGTARMRRTKASRGHTVTTAALDEGEEFVEVRVRALDGWVGSLGIDPRAISFVKSDTQGYELQVLQGAERLRAQRHIAWQLEVAPALMALAGGDLRDLVLLVQQHFTYFIDLRPDARGERRRPIGELAAALEYLHGTTTTDIIVYATGEVQLTQP